MKKALLVLLIPAAALAAVLSWRYGRGGASADEVILTGFVEGEERLVRSEVAGRVLEVLVREGDGVAAGAPLVRIDARLAASRARQQELAIEALKAEIARAMETRSLTETQVVGAIRVAEAEVARAHADAENARKSVERVRSLVRSGTTTQQELDDAESRLSQADAALGARQETLTLARDRKGEVAVAEATLAALAAGLPVEEEKLRELRLDLEKHDVRADAAGTVQARLIRPGELARPGTALVELLDEEDKYVRVYIPVPALARVHVGTAVSVELDQLPGSAIAGAVEWIDSLASFTPAKIYTQDDRTQQVYEARVRLAPGAARSIKAGAEANVRVLPAPPTPLPPRGRGET